MSEIAINCVLGALLWDNVLMDTFCVYIVTLTCLIVISMFQFEKSRRCFRFSSFLIALFLCMHHNQSGNPVCWRTDEKDTCKPLTTIPFKIRVDNSLKYLPLPACEKNFADFPFLYIFNSLGCGDYFYTQRGILKYVHVYHRSCITISI